MFGQEEGAAVGAGTGLVPTRFVWPHGGRRVYLCGDFTRFVVAFLWLPIFFLSPFFFWLRSDPLPQSSVFFKVELCSCRSSVVRGLRDCVVVCVSCAFWEQLRTVFCEFWFRSDLPPWSSVFSRSSCVCLSVSEICCKIREILFSVWVLHLENSCEDFSANFGLGVLFHNPLLFKAERAMCVCGRLCCEGWEIVFPVWVVHPENGFGEFSVNLDGN